MMRFGRRRWRVGVRAAVVTVGALAASVAGMAGPAVATVAAASPTTDCILPYGGSQGAIDFDQYRRPVGTLKGVMLFVDFPDAPATTPADMIYEDVFFPEAADWLAMSSYGRLNLSVTPLRHWLRMPEPISA